jgi:hypothetical protein
MNKYLFNLIGVLNIKLVIMTSINLANHEKNAGYVFEIAKKCVMISS